jgi:hypothetical protein
MERNGKENGKEKKKKNQRVRKKLCQNERKEEL